VDTLVQGSATYLPPAGSGLPSKIIRPAAPLQIATVYGPPSGIVFYESLLLATSCIPYLRGTTYEKPRSAMCSYLRFLYEL